MPLNKYSPVAKYRKQKHNYRTEDLLLIVQFHYYFFFRFLFLSIRCICLYRQNSKLNLFLTILNQVLIQQNRTENKTTQLHTFSFSEIMIIFPSKINFIVKNSKIISNKLFKPEKVRQMISYIHIVYW